MSQDISHCQKLGFWDRILAINQSNAADATHQLASSCPVPGCAMTSANNFSHCGRTCSDEKLSASLRALAESRPASSGSCNTATDGQLQMSGGVILVFGGFARSVICFRS